MFVLALLEREALFLREAAIVTIHLLRRRRSTGSACPRHCDLVRESAAAFRYSYCQLAQRIATRLDHPWLWGVDLNSKPALILLELLTLQRAPKCPNGRQEQIFHSVLSLRSCNNSAKMNELCRSYSIPTPASGTNFSPQSVTL